MPDLFRRATPVLLADRTALLTAAEDIDLTLAFLLHGTDPERTQRMRALAGELRGLANAEGDANG